MRMMYDEPSVETEDWAVAERMRREKLIPPAFELAYKGVIPHRGINYDKRFETAPIAEEKKCEINETKWWARKNLFSEDAEQKWGIKDLRYNRLLSDCLMSIGGEEVEIREDDADLEEIVNFGRYFHMKAKMFSGSVDDGYRNSLATWKYSIHTGDTLLVCEGYGLGEDGIWHRHTWLVEQYRTKRGFDRKERVLETSHKKYIAYYGVEQTEEQTLAKIQEWSEAHPDDAKYLEEKMGPFLEQYYAEEEAARKYKEEHAAEYAAKREAQLKEWEERQIIIEEWKKEKAKQWEEFDREVLGIKPKKKKK